MGNRFKELRLSNGLSEKEVADFLGISEAYYRKIECGERHTNDVVILKLCDFYNLSADALLGRAWKQRLFDDARIPTTEEQKLFDALTARQKERVFDKMLEYVKLNESEQKD